MSNIKNDGNNVIGWNEKVCIQSMVRPSDHAVIRFLGLLQCWVSLSIAFAHSIVLFLWHPVQNWKTCCCKLLYGENQSNNKNKCCLPQKVQLLLCRLRFVDVTFNHANKMQVAFTNKHGKIPPSHLWLQFSWLRDFIFLCHVRRHWLCLLYTSPSPRD